MIRSQERSRDRNVLRQKWVHPHINLAVEDVVLVGTEASHLNFWLLGIVVKTFPDKSLLSESAHQMSYLQETH